MPPSKRMLACRNDKRCTIDYDNKEVHKSNRYGGGDDIAYMVLEYDVMAMNTRAVVVAVAVVVVVVVVAFFVFLRPSGLPLACGMVPGEVQGVFARAGEEGSAR